MMQKSPNACNRPLLVELIQSFIQPQRIFSVISPNNTSTGVVAEAMLAFLQNAIAAQECRRAIYRVYVAFVF